MELIDKSAIVEETKKRIEQIEHGRYYYCIKDYYSGGCKRASKGEVVQALRGMSMMALGVKANEYFIPVKCIIDNKPAWSEEDEMNLKRLLSFIDTLEVKEVDLKKEIEEYLLTNATFLIGGDSKLVVHHIAKHFFELGMKAQKGE